MKVKSILLLTLLIAVSCGKKEPDQSYIIHDERSSIESVSVTDGSSSAQDNLSKQEVSELLKDITFGEDSCTKNNILRDVLLLESKIQTLGGNILDLENYKHDEVDFQRFLVDSGAQATNAIAISRAGSTQTMKSCNISNMIPPKSCWYRSLSLALLKEEIEDQTGISTTLTSHYRGSCYNEKLGGAKESDHISAKAMDISMGSQENRYAIEKFVCDNLWKENYFIQDESNKLSNISIGLGQTYIHLGLESNHGRRHWIYNDYAKKNSMPSTCWKVKI
ncbi:putative exported protein [Halobacteriovorax marinus SJ]|uniref:Exported protein n=1 Tax=Halobacteriovorax marinus (strain ATCC BAA-682 / DSM 15412 / SJ) TaxID=862908 RepID=E1WXF2_HALMS|nr:D-Ala-D-Ala carboxypeptidase family metallohydrolase [Halobacteriovorax marinus]CBW27469.1 putative exported protein [Halobacteriovorax marinus SJ]